MNDKVVQFVPKEMGSDHRLDPDEVLDGMKGERFVRLLVIGMYEDGGCRIEGNCNSGEALFLMKRAEIELVGANP